MKIGIVGWGVEGQSAYNYFGSAHNYLIVNEEPREDFPDQSNKVQIQYISQKRKPGVSGNVTDLSYLEGLENCDKIIYSPTAYKILKQKFGEDKEFWTKATTIRHIFFETVKTKNIIGVTGTKGKGTTSMLIYKMLEASGKTAYLGGNIGKSVLDFINDVQPDDWVVLELSSFQLEDFPYSPHLALCLILAPEHLDYHANLEEYLKAKSNLFSHQTTSDIAIYFAKDKNSQQLAEKSPGKKTPYYDQPGARVREDGMIVIDNKQIELIHKNEVKLLGEHNLQNICAAITAVWQINQDPEPIRKVLTSFSGLEHRLEFVAEKGGVKYYDDSFGTTPETAVVALKAFKEPKILILGGSDKGASFDELAKEITHSNVKGVVLIGETAAKIKQALEAQGFTNISDGGNTMQQIVSAARQYTQPGDTVLLSPACASFGLFSDYKDRGNQFKQTVQELA